MADQDKQIGVRNQTNRRDAEWAVKSVYDLVLVCGMVVGVGVGCWMGPGSTM